MKLNDDFRIQMEDVCTRTKMLQPKWFTFRMKLILVTTLIVLIITLTISLVALSGKSNQTENIVLETDDPINEISTTTNMTKWLHNNGGDGAKHREYITTTIA